MLILSSDYSVPYENFLSFSEKQNSANQNIEKGIFLKIVVKLPEADHRYLSRWIVSWSYNFWHHLLVESLDVRIYSMCCEYYSCLHRSLQTEVEQIHSRNSIFYPHSTHFVEFGRSGNNSFWVNWLWKILEWIEHNDSKIETSRCRLSAMFHSRSVVVNKLDCSIQSNAISPSFKAKYLVWTFFKLPFVHCVMVNRLIYACVMTHYVLLYQTIRSFPIFPVFFFLFKCHTILVSEGKFPLEK